MKIDIFTDRYEHVGTEEKSTAHAQGLWHRVFSCLAHNPNNGTVLLQRRFPGRHSFNPPTYVDVTVGGHYEAGERIEDGVRELHEELGLRHIRYADLVPIGVRQTCATLAPDYIECEFQHIHLLPTDLPIDKFPLDSEEVASIIQIDIDKAIDLAAGQRKWVPALVATREDTSVVVKEQVLCRSDFVPAYFAVDQLYLRLFLAARRYAKDQREFLLW